MEPGEEVTYRPLPERLPGLVRAVVLGPRRDADVRMGEQKLAQPWFEREAMDARAGGVDQHRARPIDDIAGGQQSASWLEHIGHGARSLARTGALVDAEDS